MKKRIVMALAGLLLVALAAPGKASAAEGVNIGLLKCRTIPGTTGPGALRE